MKLKLMLIIMFVIIVSSAFGFIQSLSNEQNISHLSDCSTNIVKKGNKLYFDSDTAVEEYKILSDGSLQLITFIPKIGMTVAKPFIIGDSLYVLERADELQKNFLKIIDISNEEMVLSNTIHLNNGEMIAEMSHFTHYLFYTPFYSITNYIFDLNTLQNIGSYDEGAFYTIKDSLFYHMTISPDSTRVIVSDISDINNPTVLSSIAFQGRTYIWDYVFKDNFLFLVCDKKIVILDITNILDPMLVATVENLPNFDQEYGILIKGEFINNTLIAKDVSNNFWLYDMTIPQSPQFISSTDDFHSYGIKDNIINAGNGYLYFSDPYHNIKQIAVSDLPNFNIINEFGVGGPIRKYLSLSKDWLLYSTASRTEIIKENCNIQSPIILSNAYSEAAANDSILVVYQNNILKVYSIEENNILFRTELSVTDGYDLTSYKNYFIFYNNCVGNSTVYDIDDNYSLNEVCSFNKNGRIYYPLRTNHYNLDYLPVFLTENGQKHLCFLNGEPPFDEVFRTSFDKNISFLENDNVAVNTIYQYSLKYFDYPNQFESYVNNQSGFAFIHNDFLLKRINNYINSGHAEFYSFLNHNYEELFEYDFNPNILDVSLSSDNEYLYSINIFNIYRYDCDYVANSDNYTPPLTNFSLKNYPNPFGLSGRSNFTTISFNIPEAGKVNLTIYNIKGQKVKTLTDEKYPKGEHSLIWNGKNEANEKVGSGVYFYKLDVNGKTENIKKCLLMK